MSDAKRVGVGDFVGCGGGEKVEDVVDGRSITFAAYGFADVFYYTHGVVDGVGGRCDEGSDACKIGNAENCAGHTASRTSFVDEVVGNKILSFGLWGIASYSISVDVGAIFDDRCSVVVDFVMSGVDGGVGAI